MLLEAHFTNKSDFFSLKPQTEVVLHYDANSSASNLSAAVLPCVSNPLQI